MNTFQVLSDFQKKTDKGAFENIKRADVVAGLRERLARPGAIEQGWSSLCGPASFLYCLLSQRPEDYVKYVIDLYDTGTAKIGTLTVAPGVMCKRYEVDPSQIHPVDWIALASLRDSDNKILDYKSVQDEVAGITLPKTLAEWFRKAGFGQVKESTQLFGGMCQTVEHIAHAGALRGQRRHVCLLVNAQMLQAGFTNLSAIPNHWIVLVKPLHLKDRKIAIQVFTWGDDTVRVPATGTADVEDFLKNYYGYVAAM